MDAQVKVDAPPQAELPAMPAGATPWRRRLLVWILPLVIVVPALWLYGSAGRYVSTDNAYVQQDRIDVAAQVSGEVLRVLSAENARVVAGQPVLGLDDTLPRIAVAAAEARLASARSDVESLKAAYREKVGEVAVAKRAAEFSLRDFDRQRQMAERKLIPASQLDTVQRSTDIAVGTASVLELQLTQTTARLGGNASLPIDSYPSVREAAAELERAQVDLAHTVVRAPQAGIVSHLPKVGSRVETGRPAFAVVTEQAVWVEANFKETDLEYVRPGQPVSVEVDTYGGRTWTGSVESIAQATGAQFSLLPAQNASGNWVKVVQRIPVRIVLQAGRDAPPLRAGMSAQVRIDTGPHTRFDRWFRRSRAG